MLDKVPAKHRFVDQFLQFLFNQFGVKYDFKKYQDCADQKCPDTTLVGCGVSKINLVSGPVSCILFS